MRFVPHLHEDWKQAWKWLQTQLGVAAGTLAMLYGFTDWLQDLLPPGAYAALNGAIGLAMVYNALRAKRADTP